MRSNESVQCLHLYSLYNYPGRSTAGFTQGRGTINQQTHNKTEQQKSCPHELNQKAS